MASSRRRARAALLCVAGIAVVGYAGAPWTMGDQSPAFAARAMSTSVTAPADHWSAGLPPAGGEVRPSTSGKPESVRSGGHAQLGIASDLELTGVILIGGRPSMAIIADAGGREKEFRVGDQIRARVILVEVSRNGVTVAHGDLRQQLPLAGRVRGKHPPPAIGPATSSREELPVAVTPSVSGAAAVPRHSANVDSEVHRQGVIVPELGGGFRMRKIMADSLYARAGLRTGDVLRSVNGRPLNSLGQLTLLYQQLNDGGQGNVELLRAGRLESLQFGGS